MIALGIDPGTARLGYGVVESEPEPQALTYGTIETVPADTMPHRLSILYDRVTELIATYRPVVVAVEQLFFARNVTTAISVGQARGVVLLAAARANVPIAEYKPAEVKQAVVGYGKAEKHQVQLMVQVILDLAAPPQPDDAADALAIALCHLQMVHFAERLGPTERAPW